jgi:ubiquinone biosynthesis protein
MSSDATLAARAAQSEWLGDDAPLAAAVQGWERHLTDERASLAAHAARLARPGPLPIIRTARHQGALLRAQLAWLTQRIPGLATGGLRGLITDPRAEVQASLARITREHLARLGPSTAEIARLIEESAGLAPDALVSELRDRPIEIAPLPRAQILASLPGLVREQIAELGPVIEVRPISQAHAARLHDGRSVSLHVRRPGAAQTVREDARILATVLAGLEFTIPAARVAHPRGLLEVVTLQMLEENDLRNEALNAVELGLAVESLGLQSVVVARPLPLLVAPEAAGFESFAHSQRLSELPVGAVGLEAIGDLARLVVEAAFSLGVFPADLHRDRFTALPDGRLAVTGCSTIGRLDRTVQRGTIDLLVSLMGGDVPGQVAALAAIGAVPTDADLDGLEKDLANITPPDFLAVASGMAGAPFESLNDVIDMAIRHRLRPPLVLMLFARTLLALNATIERINPALALPGVLLPLVMRLPELRAALDD